MYIFARSYFLFVWVMAIYISIKSVINDCTHVDALYLPLHAVHIKPSLMQSWLSISISVGIDM